MTTTLKKLLITVLLFGFAVTACEKARVTTGNDDGQVQLAQHGKTSCVLVDAKVFCAPGNSRAPSRMAHSTID